MNRVVIVGAAGAVGSRVLKRLASRAGYDIVAVDVRTIQDEAFRDGPSPVDLVAADITMPTVRSRIEGADIYVHLATRFDSSHDGSDPSALDLAAAEALLEAASASARPHVVMMSSAMVYGARIHNPVPLTEAAPVDPNPGFAFAETKAAVEKVADTWLRDAPDRTLTVLRPTTALAAGESTWVARTMRASAGLAGEYEPPLQFVHLDDLADAVLVAITERLAGTFNVAPDGWIDGYEVRQLVGKVPRIRLPFALAAQVAATVWRNRLAATPPGIVPYTHFPWVVANDRMRAAGWVPQRSNAEVYVEGVPPRPWAMVNARQRQKLVAAGIAGVGVALAGVGVVAWRWMRTTSR